MLGGIAYREQIVEWRRITEAGLDLVQHRTFRPGQLRELHEDVRTLQRSRAGMFLKEVIEAKVLPQLAKKTLEQVKGHADLVDGLEQEWTHFYLHVLSAIEAIFVHVQRAAVAASGRKKSIRHMVLLSFREHVLLPLQPQLTEYLGLITKVPPTLQQLFLVLQSVPVEFPVGESELRFEALTAMAISPFWGLKGLYENRYPQPVIISKELFKRRPSSSSSAAGDTRRSMSIRHESRSTLSVASGYHASTLTELFSLSAERCCKHRMLPL